MFPGFSALAVAVAASGLGLLGCRMGWFVAGFVDLVEKHGCALV
jgi:hypothetical protein